MCLKLLRKTLISETLVAFRNVAVAGDLCQQLTTVKTPGTEKMDLEHSTSQLKGKKNAQQEENKTFEIVICF